GGVASGRAMVEKVLNRPSPSTRGAYSSSTGRAMENWRMTKVANTDGAPKMGTRINGQCVLIIFQDRNIWNSGTMVTSAGIKRPISTTMKMALLNGKRMRAKA